MGFILTLTASLLLFILTVPAVIIGTIISLFKHTGNAYYKDIAIGLDHLGNVICQHVFNVLLIKKNSNHLFGNIKESISGVLGKNYYDNTCTNFGLFWCRFLNSLEKDHVKIAIDNTVD